ncbi:MAG: hypothetical protein ACI80V_003406 [Rhodothermales bacterium]|jgi:hypothetical protein
MRDSSSWITPSRTLVTVSFSEPMDAATITPSGNVVLRPFGGQPLEGSLSIPANTSLAFKPDAPLANGIRYELVLSGLTDPSGSALATTSRTFSTPMTPAFTAGLFGPQQGATGVSIETHIFVDFSVPVDMASLNATSFDVGLLTGGSVVGAFSLLNGGTRVVFAPQGGLAAFTDYRVMLSPAILDTAGRSLTALPQGAVPSWTFKTGNTLFELLALTPRTAVEGSKLTIEGTGFLPDLSQNEVTFSGVSGRINAPVTRATLSSLSVVVPIGATTGLVSVSNVSGSDSLPF